MSTAALHGNILNKRSLPPIENTGWPWSTVDSTAASSFLPQGLQWPKISIVTPSYNQGEYLEKTIRSVLLQDYPNLEYIVIDGGSTDNSIEIIKKYEPWLAYWVSEKDRGQSHAINKGLERATGVLFGWLNSDDWYAEGALFKLARAHLENPSAAVIYGQGYIVDKLGKVVHIPSHVQITRDNLFDWGVGCDFMQPSSLFLREVWLECGPLDESLHYSLDVDLWLKISLNHKFLKIDDLLSIALSHDNAKTTAQREAMFADLAVVMMRHGNEKAARKILNILVSTITDQNRKLDMMRKLPMFKTIIKLLNK